MFTAPEAERRRGMGERICNAARNVAGRVGGAVRNVANRITGRGRSGRKSGS